MIRVDRADCRTVLDFVADELARAGRPVSTGSLTFDRYEQDQVIQMLQREDGDHRFAGFLVTDRPEGQLNFAMA